MLYCSTSLCELKAKNYFEIWNLQICPTIRNVYMWFNVIILVFDFMSTEQIDNWKLFYEIDWKCPILSMNGEKISLS